MLPASDRSRTKYVGRKEELDLLNTILHDVLSGKGMMVLVDGEAGIGKTRLIEEMKDLPNFKGFKFLMGRCLYFKDTDIYLPFKDVFNQYRKLSKDGEEVEVSPFSPKEKIKEPGSEDKGYAEDLVPMSLIPAGIEPEDKTEMVVEGILEFEKLTRFIFKMASQGPVCIFIDDLHWADPPSIKVLQYLASKIRDHRILIICTYRPEDLFWGEENPHPLSDPLKRLRKEKLYIPISLKRLTQEETDILLKSILEIERVPPTFSALIFRRTSGNPFFVEEVLYSLMERNVIDPSKPDWYQSLDPDTISLPTTLRDIILRRMHWLKANSINVIRLSSVSSGTKITFEIIKDSLSMADEDVLQALEELVQAKFLKEITADESYEFENPVIQEIVYSELNHSRRRFLHTKMASVLESKHGEDPDFWGQIGVHFYKGKDMEKALKFLTKASSYFQKPSPLKALEYLHMVLDCMEKIPQSDSIKAQNLGVLLDISDLCLQIGDWERSLEFAEKGLNLATILRQPSSRTRARTNIGEVFKRRGDYDKALSYFQEVVNGPQDQTDNRAFTKSYMGMGYIHWRRGDYPKALEMFSKSLQFAKVDNDPSVIGALYINIGNVFNHRGDVKKALDYYSRGIKHLEGIGSVLEAARGYSNMGTACIMTGNLEDAEKYLALSAEKAKEQGRQDLSWPNINFIQLRTLQGKFAEARRIYDTVMEDIKEREDKVAMGVAMMYMGECSSRVGEMEESEMLLIRAISIFEPIGASFDLARGKALLGEHYVRMERFEEARVLLLEAYKAFKAMGATLMMERTKEKLLELRGGEDFI